MRRNIAFLMILAGLFAGAAAFPAYADLGLSGILSAQGEKAVGLSVKDAVSALYSSGQGDDAIQAGIIGILNEAVAAGNEEAVRYALVGVLIAGGKEHLDLSKAAIDDSNAFRQFPDTTASVVSSASLLISGAGGASQVAEGDGGSPDGAGVESPGAVDGGGQAQAQGGGSGTQTDLFGGGAPTDPTDDDTFVPFGTIRDRDTSATPV